jgi:nitrogen fixation protein FixH
MNLIRDRWMFVPVLLLGVSVTTAFVTVSLAVRGHSLGVEPDYYEQSKHWSEVQAQMAANERLGWIVSPDLGPGENGHPRLNLSIKDKHGIPIPVDAVHVEAIPIRNADMRVAFDLDREREGEFAGDVPLKFAGQWEFRIDVERGEQRYTDSFRRTIEFAKRAQ